MLRVGLRSRARWPASKPSAVGLRKRDSQAFTGIASSALSRGLTALAPIIVIPQSLSYLGADLYGAWASALSVTSVVAFSDLGIGTGLMTKLAALDPASEARTARGLISSGYAMAVAVAALLLSVLWASAPLVDWGAAVGAHGAPGQEVVEPLVLATLSAFLFMIPVGLIVRVQYGSGQVAVSNLWQATGAAAGIGAVFIAVRLDPGPAAFVAIAAFTPVAFGLLNTAWFFLLGSGRQFAPRITAVALTSAATLLRIGSKFLLIFALLTLGSSLDTWIAAHTVSLEEAARFQVPNRVVATVGALVISVLSMPLWPLHADAHSKGDWQWMARTTRRMTLLTTASVTGAMLLVALVAPVVMPAWLGESDLQAPQALWYSLALWWVIQSVSSAAFMAQNGAQVLRPQTIGYALFALGLPVKWLACSTWGVVALPLVSCALFTLAVWPSCVVGYRRAISETRQHLPEEAH